MQPRHTKVQPASRLTAGEENVEEDEHAGEGGADEEAAEGYDDLAAGG